jgi:hypothetical protein
MATAWEGEGIWNLCWWMSLFRLGHQVCSMRSQNQRNTCHKRHVVASVSSVSSVSSANKKSDGWKGTVLVSMSLWLWLLVARRADVFCRTRRAKRYARWSYCDQGRGGAQASNGDHEQTGILSLQSVGFLFPCIILWSKDCLVAKCLHQSSGLHDLHDLHGSTTFNNFKQLPQETASNTEHINTS